MASPRDNEADETSPLLALREGRTTHIIPPKRKLRSGKSILVVMFLVVLLLSFGEQLREAPEIRIFESIICYRYYELHNPSKIDLPRSSIGPGAIGGVDEMWCKNDNVQDDLAQLVGYQDFFDGFPFLLFALPFGWAADRFGRWPVLFLNLVQILMRIVWTQFVAWYWQAFDIRMIWVASVFSCLGGGAPLASNLFFVAVSDVTAEEERSAVFLRLGATNLAAHLCMPLIAAWLMTANPWIPSLIGTACMMVAIILFCFVPETLSFRHRMAPTTSSRQMPMSETTPTHPEMLTSQGPVSVNLVRRSWASVRSSLSFLTDDWRVSALIMIFTLHILLSNVGRLLLQYLSKRCALTFSKATVVNTIRYGIIFIILFVILPYLTKIAKRNCGLSGQKSDLYLARASEALLAIGWLSVAASPTIVPITISLAIASLGDGAFLLVRSFLTSLLPTHHIAKVYSIVSLVDMLGSMFGSPLLAGLFARGLALGGGWVGLPFYFIGLIAAFFTGTLFVVRLKKTEGHEPEGDE